MNTTNWRETAELIGIAAIVASLVFVGLQMKQTHEIAYSSVYQSRANASSEVSMSLASNAPALSGWRKFDDGQGDQATLEEIEAGVLAQISLIFLWENSLFQYERGYIPIEHWDSVREDIKSALENPLRRSVLEARMNTMRPTFRQAIVELIDEIESQSTE